jgi:DegV family protein with EDD domain
MGITVVPLNVHFGEETYRDGVDMDSEQFFSRLTASSELPTTSQPSAGVFAETYERLAQDADAIISIHIAQKLSGTINSAITAREITNIACPVEVIDTLSVSMGLGLTVIAAARAAQSGASREEVLNVARTSLENVRTLVLVDTLEYLQKGGRIGSARAFLGTLLSVKPLIKVEDGEIHPVQQVRTRNRALSRLYDFAAETSDIDGLALVHTTTPEEADAFAQRLGAIYPIDQLHVSRMGPVVGTYTGPGTMALAVRSQTV